MKKNIMVGILSTVMVMSMSITAFAGQWRSDANGWWYQNDDGSYPASTLTETMMERQKAIILIRKVIA